MTTGLGSATAAAILNELVAANGAWSTPASCYVQLHLGDPGAAGTANAAANSIRQAAVFSTATAAGAITTSADITWTSVSNTEVYAYVSFWSASTAGTLLATDNLEVTRSLTAGDNFTIATGDIDITLGAVAA